MATIGRAFGFYVKFWQEMQACYEDIPAQSVLTKSLPAESRGMIEAVGKRAGEQAAAFLASIRHEIEAHFRQLGCQAKSRNRPTYLKTHWSVEVRLDPKGRRQTARKHWSTGVSIAGDLDARGGPVVSLYFWIWAEGSNDQGSRRAEDQLAGTLGAQRTKYRGSTDGDTGSVVYGELPLTGRLNKRDFGIGKEELIESARGVLKTINKRDIRRFFEI